MRALPALALLAACLLTAPAGADEEAASPAAGEAAPAKAEAATANAPAGLAGVWMLDYEASDDVDPLLVTMGRSQVERTMAARVTKVQHTIVVGDGWIELENKNFARTTKNRTQLGVEATADLMGQEASVRTEVVGGDTVRGSATIEVDGAPVRFRADRTLQADDTMLITIRLEPEGGEPVVVKRLFRRKS